MSDNAFVGAFDASHNPDLTPKLPGRPTRDVHFDPAAKDTTPLNEANVDAIFAELSRRYELVVASFGNPGGSGAFVAHGHPALCLTAVQALQQIVLAHATDLGREAE